MKKINLFILTVVAAAFIAACGSPAGNAPANATNANAAKPAAAAPTVDALLALDKQANEAFFKGDSKFFEGFLSDKFVMLAPDGTRIDKAAAVKMIAGLKCDIKEGWKLEEPQMAKIDADTYVLSYKGTFDGTCTENGKTDKAPSPVRAASVFVRSGDKWLGTFHGENMIIDPKAPPPAPTKKQEPKKDDAKKADTAAANSNSAAPAKPTADANTDALVKIHTSGWEAWKARDAKKFDEIVSANMSFVDPIGTWINGKAAVIKLLTETMKCEGITKVSVTDGFASAISPTVSILTTKGTADGTCDGQKNGSLWGSAIYVKEGDAWKLAFLFESPAM